MHSTKWPAPPSRRSSRSTLVMTTYFSLSAAIVRARFLGSSTSSGSGRPWPTSQNGQRRGHFSPLIMNVGGALPEHLPVFGGHAPSPAVCRVWSRRVCLVLLKRLLG